MADLGLGEDQILAVYAARALGAIGPAARDVLPVLEQVREDRARALRRAPVEAIEAIEAALSGERPEDAPEDGSR